MKVMLDLDGVIYDFQGAANAALSARYGYADIGEWTHWNYGKEQVSKEAWSWLWSEEGSRAIWTATGPERKYGKEIGRYLGLNYDLIIVTHRPGCVEEATAGWLKRAEIIYDELWVLDHTNEKSVYAKDCAYAIEDKPENVDDLLDNTYAKVIMPKLMYSSTYSRVHQRLEKIDRLEEILAYL